VFYGRFFPPKVTGRRFESRNQHLQK